MRPTRSRSTTGAPVTCPHRPKRADRRLKRSRMPLRAFLGYIDPYHGLQIAGGALTGSGKGITMATAKRFRALREKWDRLDALDCLDYGLIMAPSHHAKVGQ